MRTAAAPDVRCIRIEDAVVMGLAILCKSLDDVRVWFVSISLQRIKDHAKAAVRYDGALQWEFGLQADDHFVIAIDIARRVRGYSARNLRNIQHAFFSLHQEQFVQFVPDLRGPLGYWCKERVVAFVGGVILLDEIAHIDPALPETNVKTFPLDHFFSSDLPRSCGHAKFLLVV